MDELFQVTVRKRNDALQMTWRILSMQTEYRVNYARMHTTRS